MSAGPRRWLRAAFMQAEALFNRAFGDPLNPLYHLGALTFWLFWIVCGTGLFLYASSTPASPAPTARCRR
jgi:hypothetical protein